MLCSSACKWLSKYGVRSVSLLMSTHKDSRINVYLQCTQKQLEMQICVWKISSQILVFNNVVEHKYMDLSTIKYLQFSWKLIFAYCYVHIQTGESFVNFTANCGFLRLPCSSIHIFFHQGKPIRTLLHQRESSCVHSLILRLIWLHKSKTG